jgi:mRNA-degrading endonuclease RelE of RelBE toxin-antitoxin system
MAWKVSYKSSFLRNYKKLPKNIQEEILNIADQIQAGENGAPLYYNWGEFYSWHFERKPEYRLVYIRYQCLLKDINQCKFEDIEHINDELKDCDGLIEYVLIDTRENFNKLYKMSKKDIDKYRRT